jgi:multiple sugar transport system ATP-binding protein
MASITIKEMTKRFGDVVAVNNMDLSIADREFLVLLGPSGAGKTTTLRCVAGLEKPEKGEVYFDDVLCNDVSPADRDVAFVFQSYALYPRKTAFENVAFPLEARQLSKEAITARVYEVAAKLHIEHLLDRRPQQLSGGEQQRVALGRAMVREPRLFIMDEPLTNLDFKLRVEMRTELKRIHRDLNQTLFYVTNDQTEAMSMADRIAVLNLGVLQQVGVPDEVYDHPANLFVAGFIGSPRMSFLHCVLAGDGSPALCDREGLWALPVSEEIRDCIKAGATGEDLILGVRAEDITLSPIEQPDAIAADVYAVEPLGDRNIFDLSLGANVIKVKTPPTLNLAIGTRAWMTIDTNRIHVFDHRTEKAIL